jgi:ABC-2 type transport system permease protein
MTVLATLKNGTALTNGVATLPPQPQPLAGFANLLRFMVRRDRVRAPVWIVSITGVIAASAASMVGLYDTPAKLLEYAELAQLDPALKAIAGPGHGLDDPTLGAVVMNEVLIYTFVIIALMCIFLMIRHTRGEEETDRAELVRAAPIGRLATLAAACVWVAIVNAVVAVALTLSLLAFGLTTTGTVAFGAACWGIGMVFIGVAAATAQIASSARAANATAGAVLGASFMLRAVGDLGNGWVTWLSPLGWAQSIKAFAGEQWWVLIPMVVATAALVSAGVALSARRDLGAGLMKQRPGPIEGSPRLATPLAMAARLQRTSLISWATGLALLGFFFGLVADQAEQMLESEAIAEFFAAADVGTPTELFLATMVLMVALTATGYTVSTVLRLRSEEVAVRAEPVLATAVGRRTWAMSYLVVSLVGTIVVMMVAGLAIGIGTAAQLGDTGNVLPVLGASLSMVPALSVLGAVTIAIIGWRPKWSQLAWVGVAVSAIAGLLAETLNLPQWLRNVSPFEHVPSYPAASFELLPLAVISLVAVVVAVAGLAGIARRDIG